MREGTEIMARTKKPEVHPRLMGATAGDRVRLLHTTDEYTALRAGALGTVQSTDSLGTLHVTWDEGSSLGLIAGEDRWETVTECRVCRSTDLQAGGFDGNDEPITVCAGCGERQEEE